MSESESKKRRKKSSRLSTVLLVVIFLAGIGIMAYPTVSDYWNSLHQSRAIASYTKTVESLDKSEYDKLWQEAAAYNRAFADHPVSWEPTEEELAVYNQVLDISGTGIMGYIEIPKIGCSLPIYHGTNEAILQVAIGHLPGSSLPVGGETSHCLVSGHRGLPSARLFTDLDKMEVGDLFYLRVLNETLTYEVDSIRIIEPSDLSLLGLVPGQDLVTLVTCTPYGINTHRLLVRGHRIETIPEDKPVVITADALRVSPRIVIPAVGIPVLFIFLLVMLLLSGRKTNRTSVKQDNQNVGGAHERTNDRDHKEESGE